VKFYYVDADPTKSYSYTAISQTEFVSYSTVSTHMDLLVSSGLVKEVEGVRSTEYQLDTSSDMYQFLIGLNDAVARFCEKRTEDEEDNSD
jgi:predicted transcriptional regulator